MNFKQLADSIYLIPVLLDHFSKPTDITTAILKEYDINERKVEEFRKVKSLLTYHLNTVRNWQPDYPLLRQGLSEYFDAYMKHTFKNIGFTNKEWEVLDYGCGSGKYGLQFHELNPQSHVYFLDRDHDQGYLVNYIRCDFEKQPMWYMGYLKRFDCVIMSELLHCKDFVTQQYLITSAYEILAPKGKLVVIENADYCMAYRIARLKDNTNINIVHADLLKTLTFDFFNQIDQTQVLNHNIVVYEKI
ncbi:MAG TPA: class I SAM-dependent methyltransferase [Flavobacterium sp.]|nr:class I SAM-dependent methyltransferase [Flavobacterium sp.]